MNDAEESLNNLNELFNNKFSDDNRYSIYFRPVYNFETERDDITKIESNICSIEQGTHMQVDLTFKTLNNGNKLAVVPRPISGWCDAIQKNSHIIGADGSIFACDTLMVDKDKAIGFIDDNGAIIKNDNYDIWKSNQFKITDELNLECKKCKMLPICMGGCKRFRIIDKKTACMFSESEIEYIIKKSLS